MGKWSEKTGLHWLDGELGKPERVLTVEQTKGFNKLVDNLPNLLNKVDLLKNITSNISLPDFNNLVGRSQSTNNTIHIDKLEFPNITNPEGLQQAILDLPRLALQYK